LKIPFSAVLFSVFSIYSGSSKKCEKTLNKSAGNGIYILEIQRMATMDSVNRLPFATAAANTALSSEPSDIEREVIEFFDQFRNPLLRYALSFGVPVHDAEEVTQEVFLSLFRHLQLSRSRKNLRAWIFRVAHNLALKQLYANQRSTAKQASDWTLAEERFDPSPNPEEQLSSAQRQRRLLSALCALPQVDQSCLRLRAEGLRYREIAEVLGISLGAVSISLTRSLARLTRADQR
jgi:RNA polymerase sigma-70 factor (ECF subfamily)